MTKEQFLDGTPFYIGGKRYAGDSTFHYSKDIGCICKQSRSSIDEKVVIDDYECNMGQLGRIGFTGFTHVMGKRVIVKYRFSDLVPFEDQGPEYDGAGFSIEDREDDIEDQSHHCDDPSCNCSI